MRFPNMPRIPRPSWPFRRSPKTGPGDTRSSTRPEAAELAGPLRAFRTAALWAITALIITAAGSAFAESYRGLWLWAQHHGLAGFWAAAFPLQIDLFVAVGEIVLFVAMVDRWGWRDRAGAWAVALLGLAASVAGNVGHVAAHDLQSRGTAAVPPVAAFAALWLGLGVIKRILRRHDAGAVPVTVAADETAPSPSPESVWGDRFAELLAGVRAIAGEVSGAVSAAGIRGDETALLGELAASVKALGEQVGGMVSSAVPGADQTALLAELLEAVRGLGSQISGAVSSAVPVGSEHAALLAYRASVAAGNPYSMNALQARFGLTRTQVSRIRKVTEDDPGGPPELALANGHQAGDGATR